MTEEKALTKGEQTRAAIIDAAYSLFLRNGFHGTSMRRIAEKADLALGGIYNHFSSKEEIFAAVLDAYHPYRRILPALEAASGDTIEKFVRDGAERVRSAIEGSEKHVLPLAFIELVEFQGRHLAQLAQILLPSMFAFAQRFAERRGKLRNIPLPVMLRAFIGIFLAFLFTEMVLKNMPLLKNADYDWFGGMVDIYLHGILEPEA
jgi:AcrR family transcriptional regulator